MAEARETDALDLAVDSGAPAGMDEAPSASMTTNSSSRMTSSIDMSTLASMRRSSASDLIFSKRSSEEAAALKPAEYLEAKRKSERVFPVKSVALFLTWGLSEEMASRKLWTLV